MQPLPHTGLPPKPSSLHGGSCIAGATGHTGATPCLGGREPKRPAGPLSHPQPLPTRGRCPLLLLYLFEQRVVGAIQVELPQVVSVGEDEEGLFVCTGEPRDESGRRRWDVGRSPWPCCPPCPAASQLLHKLGAATLPCGAPQPAPRPSSVPRLPEAHPCLQSPLRALTCNSFTAGGVVRFELVALYAQALVAAQSVDALLAAGVGGGALIDVNARLPVVLQPEPGTASALQEATRSC